MYFCRSYCSWHRCGKKYSVKKHDLRKSWGLNYSYLSEADRTKLQNLHDAVDGTFDTFLFAEDNDFSGTLGTDYFTVRFTKDDLKFQQVASGAYSVSFTVEEELWENLYLQVVQEKAMVLKKLGKVKVIIRNLVINCLKNTTKKEKEVKVSK